jgi:hypothetical protein
MGKSKMIQDDSGRPWTLSVPEAGRKYFGLSRQGSYDAAARGELPTVKIGRLLRVPVRKLEQQLTPNLDPAA